MAKKVTPPDPLDDHVVVAFRMKDAVLELGGADWYVLKLTGSPEDIQRMVDNLRLLTNPNYHGDA